MQNKILISSLAASVTLLLGTAITPSTVEAATATGTNQGNTTIQFTVPTDGQLVLNKVPSFDFGNHALATSYSAFTATGDTPYDVTNLTGDSNGYTVTAQAGQLTNGSNVLPVSSLTTDTADGTADSVTGGKISGATGVSIYQASNKVATGNATANGELQSGTTGATLTLSSPGVKTGAYTGVIDYTITDGIN